MTTALFSASDRGSIALGSVRASVPAVADWETLYSVHREADGEWSKLTDNADPGTYRHFTETGIADFLDRAPCAYAIDLRRGEPVPGETANRVRASTGEQYVDVDLDAGTRVAGACESVSIKPLGDGPDDGYRVTMRCAGSDAGAGLRVSPLVAGSDTFADPTGAGHFYAKRAEVEQLRVERWTVGEGLSFEQPDPALQLVLWRDGRGPCLVFTETAIMVGSPALVALVTGVEKPCTLLARCDCPEPSPVEGRILEATDAAGRDALILGLHDPTTDARFVRAVAGRLDWSRVVGAAPFAGVLVGRYTGAQLLLRVNGRDADPVVVPAGSALAAERVTLGSAVACPRYLRIREVGIDGRAWTDAGAAS